MAVVQVPSDSALYSALYPQIQTKVVNLGWSNSDDTSLTDFVLLTLANGKTEADLSSEIKDLLEDGEYLEKLPGFTTWLVGEILSASGQGDASGTSAPSQLPPTGPSAAQATAQNDTGVDTDQPNADEDMSEVPTGPSNGAMQVLPMTPIDNQHANAFDRPSGPRSMRGGAPAVRGGRGNRNAPEASLHRIKGTANAGRINAHSGRDSPRGTPRGPRGGFRNNTGRGGINATNVQAAQQAVQQPGGVPSFTPEQQSFVANMMSENMSMLAGMFAQQQQQTQMGGNFGGMRGNRGGGRGRGGRSLFDRVEGQSQPNGNQHQQRPQSAQNGESQNGDSIELTSSMEVESNSQSQQRPDPSNTVCKFNLFCTKPDCPFAHSAPNGAVGVTVDMNDQCQYGTGCKNRKCTGKHPSPAAAAADQQPPICKFFPNCSNPYCSFLHPSGPACRNGADCTTPNCPFTHNPTPCKFNPCTNPSCPYKHQEGQKQVANRAAAFAKSSWINPDLRTGGGGDGDHKSERKFINENAKEETIIPGAPSQQEAMQAESTEVV